MSIEHDRVNNFDALRLVGAVLVLLGHAYPLNGRGSFPQAMGSPLAVLGVLIFFAVSGYLITQSWSRESRLLPYLKKRALRIFPALAVVVLLTTFVLGPAVTALSTGAYLTHPGTWLYLANIPLFPVYSLPGVFGELPYSGAVNGSLWTLPIEFACYLMVPLVFLLPDRWRAPGFLALAVVFTSAGLVFAANEFTVVIYGTSLTQALAIWPYFMVGAAIAASRGRIPLRLDVALVALVGALVLESVSSGTADFVWRLALPYLIITFGSMQTPVVRRIGRYGDFSYGLYLVAFPVQQLVVFLWPAVPFGVSVLLTILFSGAFAIASWHVIEKPALRLKSVTWRPREVIPES